MIRVNKYLKIANIIEIEKLFGMVKDYRKRSIIEKCIGENEK